MQLRPVTPHEMFFARPTFRANVKNIELPDDVSGMAPFAEAFASQETRDAALGIATEHMEFVPLTWLEAQSGGAVESSIAVGHSRREPGFDVIAPSVLSSAVDEALTWRSGRGKIIIARVEYHFEFRDGACGNVACFPTYPMDSDNDEVAETAMWVHGQVSHILARKAHALAPTEGVSA